MTTTIGSVLVPASSIDVAHPAGLATQRFGRGQRHHHLTGDGRLEHALLVGRPALDHHGRARQARRRVGAQLPVHRAVARDLEDQARVRGHHTER